MTDHTIDLYDKCMKKKFDYLITGSDVVTYGLTPFNIWCKYFADRSKKDPYGRVLEILSSKGIRHEDEVRRIAYSDAIIIDDDNKRGNRKRRSDSLMADDNVMIEHISAHFKKGIEFMNAGEDVLAECPLIDLRYGLYGTPDILERVDGKSIFGSYHYIVKEIKSSLRISKSHKMQAAFYNLLMGRIQEYIPKKFYVIDGGMAEHEIEFSGYENALYDVIDRVVDIRNKKCVPIPTYGLSTYPWNALCNKMAVDAGDISIICGMKKRDTAALRRNGIRTVDDFVSSNISKMRSKSGIDSKTLSKYMRASKSHDTAVPIRADKSNVRLSNSRTEVYLDIYANNTKNNIDGFSVYAAGMLIRDGQNEEFMLLVADPACTVASRIVEILRNKNDCTVYHSNKYNYELLMDDIHQLDVGSYHSIVPTGRTINLYNTATRCYTFPMPRCTINAIAVHIGFERTSYEIDPSWIYSLHLEYRKNIDMRAEISEIIEELSMDNCRTMLAVKDWLVKEL